MENYSLLGLNQHCNTMLNRDSLSIETLNCFALNGRKMC